MLFKLDTWVRSVKLLPFVTRMSAARTTIPGVSIRLCGVLKLNATMALFKDIFARLDILSLRIRGGVEEEGN